MWQMHADVPLEDQTHETFWQQILRWLVSDTPGQITLTPLDEPALNQPIEIQADVRDPAYRPVNDAQVVAYVEAPDGSTREIPMPWTARRAGEYQLSFTPTVPGQHTLRVEARHGDETSTGTLLLDAAEDGEEYYGAQMRAPLPQRIAEETGGRFYTMSSLQRLPEELRYSGQGVTRLEQMDLWDMPIVFLLIVGLVASEWGYRRWRGLP
jgi:hypothetical protein